MLKGSWRTTALGILGGIGILVGQATAVLDHDPATVFSWDLTLGALGLLGIGWFSRDKGVSSEQQAGRR